MISIFLVIMSYLIGSLSSAIILCQLLNIADPRTQGSCNPGATNVLRYAGKQVAFLTLFFDILKGWLVVVLASYLDMSDKLISACAIAVFIGHIHPIFFKFKGGKGVATAFGILLGISSISALFSSMTWFIVAYWFRYSSLAALSTALLAPIFVYLMTTNNLIFTITVSLISVGLFLRHQDNIRRLLLGQESKIS